MPRTNVKIVAPTLISPFIRETACVDIISWHARFAQSTVPDEGTSVVLHSLIEQHIDISKSELYSVAIHYTEEVNSMKGND